MIWLLALLLYYFPHIPEYNDPHDVFVAIVSGKEGSEYNGAVINQAKQECLAIPACAGAVHP